MLMHVIFFNTYWLSVLNSLFPPYLAFPIDVVSSTTKHRLSASMADNPEVLTPLLTTERTADLHSAFTSILSFTLSLRLFNSLSHLSLYWPHIPNALTKLF